MRREKNLETLDENHAEGSQMSQQLGLMTISRQEDRVQAEHKLWLYMLHSTGGVGLHIHA